MADAEGWAQQVSDRIGRVKQLEREPYRPGAWRQVTLEEQVATLAKDMYDGALEVEPGYDKAELRKLCMDFALEQIPAGVRGRIILRNGPATIQSSHPNVGRTELEAVAEQVDDMASRFPVTGRMMIGIVEDGFGMSDERADGQTVHGEAFIQLKGKVWREHKTAADGFMPAQDHHERWQYTLAHEWGHAIDHADGLRQMMAAFSDDSPHLSAYGESSPREAYAEAFAEWYLTKGHTTNKAARFYAKEFGWGEPW
jgi:hypothetical protein